ncbi:MAG: hypothetical protein ACUVV4_02555 [Candidatus Bathyarchaeia archaeon]
MRHEYSLRCHYGANPRKYRSNKHIIGRHENITVVYIKAKSTYSELKRFLKIVEEGIHTIHNIGVPVTIIAISRDAAVLIGCTQLISIM